MAQSSPEAKRRYKQSEKGKAADRAYAKRRYANDAEYRERSKAQAVAQSQQRTATERRRISLLHLYNLTLEDYDALLAAQGYRCAGCGEHFTTFKRPLAVDHDHACCPAKKSCGKCVRGLLCGSCNNALGRVKDKPAVLRALADYLERT